MPKGIFERPVRPVDIDGDIARVTLTRGRVAIIDARDVPLVSTWNWQVTGKPPRTCYAGRCEYLGGGRDNQRSRIVHMHRLLLEAPDGLYVDHIDGDGLNNRRSNLRLCTIQQNAFNAKPRRESRSGVKGVMPNKRRWMAQISIDGYIKHLGTFDTVEEAARAYAAAAVQVQGEFARF